MKIISKLLYFLTPQEKKNTILLFIITLIMALIDMVGVASIMPFIAVLSNPDLIDTNVILNKIFQTSSLFGVQSDQEFIFFLGIIVFIFLILSLVVKALTTYFQLRFVQMREYTIGKRLMDNYLHQPYSWFLNRNSSDIGKSILSEVGLIIGQGLSPLLNLITQCIVTFFIASLLLIVNFKLTIIVASILFIFYGLIFNLSKKFLNRIGHERVESNELRFKVISEAFGASKDVKLNGLEEIFVKKFSNPAKLFAKHQTSSQVLGKLPRFALEAIAFGGMLLVILYTISQSGNFANAIPIITLYAFAGYRLMPSLQLIYASSTMLKYATPAINSLYNDFISLKTNNYNNDQSILKFNKTIALNNVNYSYPNTSRTTLKNINLIIPSRSTVGLVGPTGCGKTTTVDIILGLLQPQNGTLKIDDQIITKENSRSWQRSLGYVPQQIYLSDDTVASNIAFGINKENIIFEDLESAAKIANLHDFIINELPNKYETKVGERGIRLSGGQRQRIGIARALYHKPKVLILDEATSALDNETEKVVMEAVNNLSKNITIIMIAHRLSTVSKCDTIFQFDKGELIAEGPPKKMFRNNNNTKLI